MAAKCHGSDGKCFGILAKLGHTVVTPVPALTWFKLKEKYTKLWAGVRVKGIIKAYDEDMNEFILEGEGLLARAICHECEHLDGHMYVEKVEGELEDVAPYDEEE